MNMIKQSSIECHHGRLKRQCQECDMEKEIKELTSKITEQEKVISELKAALREIVSTGTSYINLDDFDQSLDSDDIGAIESKFNDSLIKCSNLIEHKQSKGE